MVIYQDQYWTETNEEWTIVQKLNKHNNIKVEKTLHKQPPDLKYTQNLNSNADQPKLLYSTEYENLYHLQKRF